MQILERLRDIFIPDPNPKWKIGRLGEKAGVGYLKKHLRLRVLNRNWKHQNCEIDVICKDSDTFVFVEIKSGNTHGHQEHHARAVTKQKRTAIKKAIQQYLRKIPQESRFYRYDILSVKFCQDGETDIMHYRNVTL